MFWNLDIGNGSVDYDDISFLPEDFNARVHVDFLKEDMLQISYPENMLIDVGWRPSFNAAGKFYIVAIKDGDWGKPIRKFEATDVLGVKDALRRIVVEIS